MDSGWGVLLGLGRVAAAIGADTGAVYARRTDGHERLEPVAIEGLRTGPPPLRPGDLPDSPVRAAPPGLRCGASPVLVPLVAGDVVAGAVYLDRRRHRLPWRRRDAERATAALLPRAAAVLATAVAPPGRFDPRVLRDPLALIVGYAELLAADDAAIGERERPFVAQIRRAAEQLSSLVDAQAGA